MSAIVDASLSANTIKLTLTDTSGLSSSNTWSIGQAIADVGFEITGLTGKTSITGVSGKLVNSNGTTSTLDLGNLTWTEKSNSSAIALGTIGWNYENLPQVGGAPPNELIANGKYESSWNPSLFNKAHAPDILTSVTFTINAPGVSSSSVLSNMEVAFGTQPEVTLQGELASAPAPSSIVLLGIGAFSLLGFAAIRRLRPAPSAA